MAALRARFPFRPAELTVDHLIVGGGVIGLAIAERLVKRFPTRSTYVVERHGLVGQETSSRNSEVIHAGLYYPEDSLKTRWCTRGRDLLYERCAAKSIGFKKTGKLVTASQSKQQILQIGRLFMHTQKPLVSVDSYYISGQEAREMEPELSESISCALYSPSTGIVDSHGLMSDLEKEIAESSGGNGQVVLSTRVVRVDRAGSEQEGYIVQTLTEGSEQPDVIHARSLVFSAGLSSSTLLNTLLPPNQQITPHYAKGTYVKYRGPGVSKIKTLIYPCPEEDRPAGLGTHLTLDLEGQIKFGPDVEWLQRKVGDEELADGGDWWEKHLPPSQGKLEEMHAAITSYLPGVELSGLTPDYAGIRPNITPEGVPNPDFKVVHSLPSLPNLVALVGMGSPGLTSSLAIGEAMERFFSKRIWKEGEGALGPVLDDKAGTEREWWEERQGPWWKVW